MTPVSCLRAAIGGAVVLLLAAACALADPTLRVAVYDVAPYGHADRDGLVDGASVDLWRRAAEALKRDYRLIPVAQMDAVLSGLERGDFDVAVGAITITPERLARVDFSYPAHASGVAVAMRRERGLLAALAAYGSVAAELAPLFALTLGLLLVMGAAMWIAERRRSKSAQESEIASLRDGVYWAVVTMTTVGYGDKTPKTVHGRAIAMLWMMGSIALVSIASTTLVSKMTAERVAGARAIVEADLGGRRLAAVAHSSGAEFLDARHLRYAAYADLPAALRAVARDEADAVVNSIGALRFAISTGFRAEIAQPGGVVSPAFMAFALPLGSALKKPLDRALVEITASPEWRRVEASYFPP